MPRRLLRALLEVREELRERGLGPGQVRDRIKRLLVQAGNASGLPPAAGEIDGGSSDGPDLEQAMRGATMVIGTGGGYLVDSDRSASHHVLLRLARAKEMGKVTALVGQGVGRIENPAFRDLARTVLPGIDLILVRERAFAVPLLESLGVGAERLLMAGDDAVELAYERRGARPGRDIGVSVRLAHYTEVGWEDLNRLRPVLHRAAAKHGARLHGLSTSCGGVESDERKIRYLLRGYRRSTYHRRRFEPIEDLISAVGRCRIVVAGAFHGAVFALAQGIPAIGVTRTAEYRIKFGGLVDQFGVGCQLLSLDDPAFTERLAAAIDLAWASADDLRPQLLEAAREQIHLGWTGYRRLYELCKARC